MKISYNWLKEYLPIDLEPKKVSQLLTDCGLEVEGEEMFQSVKGGLEGLIIGEVLTKEKHPDADRLNLTTVDIGSGIPANIVCGAPNVDVGQKVVVAPVGATIHPIEGEGFKMKKAKIRGQLSEGMICGEDEIGLGVGHDGIMVLDNSAIAGTIASKYFEVETDTIFEIGLTPNRADGMSHYGVARDLRAVLVNFGEEPILKAPATNSFQKDNDNLLINIEVKNEEACPRYAGVTLSGIKVSESPKWLQNRLNSIGLKPINNIVDVTNFVLHELGQPLHAFDADKITSKKVVVQTLDAKTKFTTLDDQEKELHENDLMICNDDEPMCIAGVFGGLVSGVSNSTTNIFLESAYFNPVSTRKTAKRHGLNTDASFRFERGIDPNITVEALQRASLLIKEVAGGSISSDITDLYPNPIEHFKFEFSILNCNRLIGKEIGSDKIKSILTSLDIEITDESDDTLWLSVPPYRVDVQREVDVIEEVLRIYGYNNIEMPKNVTSSLSYAPNPDLEKVQNTVSNLLSNNGYNEIMNNSLTKGDWYENDNKVVMLNPLSSELDVMRQTLLFGGLENVIRNINHKRADLKLFEFGNIYFKNENKYEQEKNLVLFVTGKNESESWNSSKEYSSLFSIKQAVDGILGKLGIDKPGVASKETEISQFQYGLSYSITNKTVVDFGSIKPEILGKLNIDQEVYYACFNWDNVVSLLKMNKVVYKPLAKFPSVRRDLSLLLDKGVSFAQLSNLAKKSERKLLKKVGLFDVYQGKNLDADKKSYALNFTLQDEYKTLSDKEIDKVMNKIQQAFEKEVGAQLR
ncbi:MAG: phenylalanine--tRNA ligase subunit beta [Flavobacteriales bacterium]|nr:phenylalanine--tRNA ligase subunit beta [Flavobacteriales bacterium]